MKKLFVLFLVLIPFLGIAGLNISYASIGPNNSGPNGGDGTGSTSNGSTTNGGEHRQQQKILMPVPAGMQRMIARVGAVLILHQSVSL